MSKKGHVTNSTFDTRNMLRRLTNFARSKLFSITCVELSKSSAVSAGHSGSWRMSLFSQHGTELFYSHSTLGSFSRMNVHMYMHLMSYMSDGC